MYQSPKRRHFLKRTLAGCVLAFAAGLSVVPQAAAAEHNWRFVNLYSRGTAYGEVYKHFAENIEAMSGGRIAVQMMYAGEGVGQTGVLGSVKSGLVTMGAPFQPMHAGEFPPGVVEVGLPGMTDDVGELSALFHERGWGEVLTEAYDKQNLVWLEPYIQLPVYVLTKEPIKSIEDFKGLKIRAPGAYGKFLRKLGASPASMAWSEIYTSLATGVIDGSIGSNLIDHRDGNHVEVAKYMYPLPIAGAQVLPIVVNKMAWNKLPDDLKAIVRTASAQHAREQMTKSRLWEQQAIADMAAKGMQWSPEPSEADKRQWSEAANSLWSEYAKSDKYSSRMVDILQKQQ
ncbi:MULTISPECIES: TRAP transporter substrate-binding protein [Photobacterium]|uniref:C4-dicarboxylate ABC transporter substrate-binding protein n=1 Tax=Photobacterium ganghwense TaxID=320778 RepID=A0A0J1K6S4_9GAMM|nr:MULTISPECIES: TRAP transporter substrate-binding protein [Photobacterium]KLV10047.1 C4-dicarboxylate ABC transporter substrate-binding protein [Photobacterium ganghwense]MBV1842695.1 TRAP transporter substrate-binding protein [Photobacterium ganghwense]PSU09095.1 C4-dicarboxylate ABC transporter substrate-binding protein [Photobacterium ganghwense]QSV16291.1 TRAP transporter substrate-binding protein DctP [Photobacterium ganghwense]